MNTGELRLGNGVPVREFGTNNFLGYDEDGNELWSNENAVMLSWANLDNQDSDGDSLMDGEELEIIDRRAYADNRIYVRMNSNPCLADTDGDGMLDEEDPEPLIKWGVESRGVGAKAARKTLKEIAYSQYPWLHFSLLITDIYNC